jgi:hypothetical protein
MPQRLFDHPEGLGQSSPDFIEASLSSSNDGLGSLVTSIHKPIILRRGLVGSQSSGKLGLGQGQSSFDPFGLSSFTSSEPDAITAYLDSYAWGLDEDQPLRLEALGENPGGSGLKRTQSQKVSSLKRWPQEQAPSTPPHHAMSGKFSYVHRTHDWISD